jgi:hypothetical protein
MLGKLIPAFTLVALLSCGSLLAQPVAVRYAEGIVTAFSPRTMDGD